MFFLMPWSVDVPQDRRPVVNWLVIVATVAVFCFQVPDLIQIAGQTHHVRHQAPETRAEIDVPGITGHLMLTGWKLRGLIGYMWLHDSLSHLLGNMLFLWIFGNAVCAKVGNIRYLLLYIIFGIVGGIAHLLFNSDPALGASGAVSGVVGMYLMFFFENEITCLFAFWFILPYVRWFDVSSIWIILLWLLWNVLGALFGHSNIAHFAHLGGFVAGFGIAFVLCYKGWITMEAYEKSLWQAWQERRGGRKDPGLGDYGGLSPLMREMKECEAAPKPVPVLSLPMPEPVSVARHAANARKREPGDDDPIIVACACGKCIRARRQYAGKIVLCPHCRARVEIPAVRANPFSDPTTSSAEEPPSDNGCIRLNCHCGKSIKVPAHYAGGAGKCPRCGARIRVPRPDVAGGFA